MEKKFITVDKPVGMTSFNVVKKLKRVFNEKKVGHAGTLDPFASGVLVIGVGKEATRSISQIQSLEKTYECSIVFGIATDTYDAYGKITSMCTPKTVTVEAIKRVLPLFIGNISQEPPVFSAKKVNGQRAYTLARKGVSVALKKTDVAIYDIEILSFLERDFPECCLRVKCSKGTYIRTLAIDIAKQLGTISYVRDLVRTTIGPYKLDSAVSYSGLDGLCPV